MTAHAPLPQATLDHSVINVRGAIDAAATTYRRLGFQLTPRGYHSLGSCNHLAIFGQNYLELLGFPEGQGHLRPELLTHPLGLSGLAFRSDNALGWHQGLSATSTPLTEARHFSRPVRLDENASSLDHEARFSTFQANIEPPLPGRVFFCQHHTPELVWRTPWQRHPNGVTDIVEVIVVSEQPEHHAAPFQRLFAAPLRREAREASTLHLPAGTATIAFTTPDAFFRRTGVDVLGQENKDESAAPQARMAGLVLRSVSLEHSARTLEDNGVAFTRNAAQQLVVAPAESFGLTLIFSH